ncbi:hypothetical protein ABV518_09745 [Arthrobacter sp. HS15c]
MTYIVWKTSLFLNALPVDTETHTTKIPQSEEAEMKKRIPHRQFHSKSSRKGREVRTGEHCPLNGWWAPAGQEADAQLVAEGSIMPPSSGELVKWTLMASQFGSRKPKYALSAAGASIDSL